MLSNIRFCTVILYCWIFIKFRNAFNFSVLNSEQQLMAANERLKNTVDLLNDEIGKNLQLLRKLLAMYELVLKRRLFRHLYIYFIIIEHITATIRQIMNIGSFFNGTKTISKGADVQTL